MYPLLTWKKVEVWLPEIDKQGVSRVARGVTKSTVTKEGFLQVYERVKTQKGLQTAWARQEETWLERRNNFVARHLAQYRVHPTYRRRLALIAWAFDPIAKR